MDAMHSGLGEHDGADGLPPGEPTGDQRIVLHQVTWEQYEQMLAIRGEAATPRMTYLRGELELMSPSRQHEARKIAIGRLLEAYAEEAGIPIDGLGSTTFREQPDERGLEPDECYVIGVASDDVLRPDLAIEVVWSRWGVDKMEVYRGLGIREVWLWRCGPQDGPGRIEVWVLEDERYVRRDRSVLLPDLDLTLLEQFVRPTGQSAAVREYRAALRASATAK